jgi:hypothetical protein
MTDVVVAATLAGLVSGAPSAAHAVVTGRSALEASRAAGELLGRPTLVRGGLAHAALSLWWTSVLAATLPRRRHVLVGATAGLAIGALDLGIARRRYPLVDALPTTPQLADHLVFGAVAATVLNRRRRP